MSGDVDPFLSAQRIPDHESAVRRMFATARGTEYQPLRSLTEAQAVPDGFVVLEGDHGGQIYLVIPAMQVVCPAATLQHLLAQLDEIAWPHDDGCGAHVYYERHASGTRVLGGMGGGAVTDDLWVHPRLVERGLTSPVRAVLNGTSQMIPAEMMAQLMPHEAAVGRPLSEDEFRARMLASIARALDKAQEDVLEPLPPAYRLLVGYFRQCGRGCEMAIDEATAALYITGSFARQINVTVLGIVDEHVLIGLHPLGRRYVNRVADDNRPASTVPFVAYPLAPIAKERKGQKVSRARLMEVGAYLLRVTLREASGA